LIGTNRINLIVGWCGRFLFFVVPRQFSQGIGEWPENQILIPDWAYFHCPGTTLFQRNILGCHVIGKSIGEAEGRGFPNGSSSQKRSEKIE